MLLGFLVHEAEGREAERIPVGDLLVIGRGADCDYQIMESSVSRRHVEIRARPGGFYWRDLGSANGTAVNGERLPAGELRHNDRIEVGNATLRFELEEVEGPDEEGPPKDETVFFSETLLAGQPALEPAKADRSEEALRAVCTVMNEIASNYEPCPLLDRILETTMKAIDAQRGAIFFADAAGQELLPCPVCRNIHMIRNGKLVHAEKGGLRISNTVAHRVLRGGETVLFQDTGDGGELNAAESIVALNLRSIICVPVRGKAGILGILYVDSDRAGHQYSYGDMLLTTAVGNSAGLAIENARMHQEMLEKQRIEQEISHAWIIQQGFLIKNWPEGETHFEVYGETRPAKTVGGDFYDFVRPDPDHIGLLIGDVSGKGIPAALTMAQLLAEFRVHAQHAATPGEMLEALNADLVIRSQRGMFCTLCYVLLDLRTGEVICANAGHQPVLCIGVSGAVEHGAATGPPTGILSDMAWKETSWSLAPGDTLLMYTDGIVEACDPAATRSQDERKDYGDDNLRRVARQMYGVHPKTLIDAVNKDVIVFCGAGAPHDDCTLVGARYLG